MEKELIQFISIIKTYVNETMIFDLQMDSQKYRCCAEQDLVANERKIYTDTSYLW